MNIFLVGNPNVGKSVLFRRLTGIYAVASNYPGTTVDVANGKVRLGDDTVPITDLPGTYSLEPNSEAECVTASVLGGLGNGDVIINVQDATNLERSMGLTLQLITLGRPTVVALNLWDEAAHTGIKINTVELERRLGVPCVPLSALSGEGLMELARRIPEARASHYSFDTQRRWDAVGRIVSDIQTVTHKHHTLAERFGDASLRPFTGTLIALAVLSLAFAAVRLIGEGLIESIFEPLFGSIWAPMILGLSDTLGNSGILHSILIGELVNGAIEYGYSFGLLTTGLYVPLGVVLPYVFSFYLVLSLLEDCGYLPRLAVIADRFMHVVGLHGIGIVPMLLGLGCNVPGALAGRIMESSKERFIAITLMAITVPCMAQVAMIIALAEAYGLRALVLIFSTLALLWISLGLILKSAIKVQSIEMILDVPPYRVPFFREVLQKVWMRLWAFMKEAVPFVLVGVLIVNVLHHFSVLDAIGHVMSPIIVSLFGLPEESIGALVIGFLRKDVAVGMLVPLELTFRQTVVASVVLTIYFPCAATFMVMARELRIIGTAKAVATMLVTVLLIGSLLNAILKIVGV